MICVQIPANYIQDMRRYFASTFLASRWSETTITPLYIRNMAPRQLKEPGINKSTLWYIRKNLREGKKVKLYDKVRTKMA